MADLFRYAAFISYSSKDAPFAKRLHRALEHYGIPSALGAFDLLGGGKKNRIYPVFRDREELSAGDLGERIEAALKASGALIVVCSRDAAASPWVQKEIEYFLSLGRRERVFAIIAENAPTQDDAGADVTAHLMPVAFRGHALTDPDALEPLAADARKGKDGFRNAWLKLVAGLIGVSPGQLIDRDKKRRRAQRRAVALGIALLALAAGLAGAIADAQTWRTRLSTYAELTTSQGQARDAAAFALAGAPARGALIHARGDRADAVLADVGAVRIGADLGELQLVRLSGDGKILVTLARDMEGAATLYDLAALKVRRNGARVALGNLGQPFVGGFQLSSGGNILMAGDMTGALKAYELDGVRQGGAIIAHDLGSFVRFITSADGKTALAQTRDGRAMLLDVDAVRAGKSGAQTDLSALGDTNSAYLSDNGAVLILRTQGDRGQLVDLAAVKAGRPPARIDLGAFSDDRGLRGLHLSADGAVLFILGYDDHGALFDLEGFKVGRADARKDLGDLRATWGHVVSADGKTLVAQHEDFTGALYDLGRGGVRADLGDLGPPQQGVMVSDDGAVLVAQGADRKGILIDLNAVRAGQSNARFTLGDLGTLRARGLFLSGDGDVLFALGEDRTGARIDVAAAKAGQAGARRALGDLGAVSPLLNAVAISADGAFLLAQSADGKWTLYDLSNPVWPGETPPRGGALSGAVCAASADAIRPFTEEMRGVSEAAVKARAAASDAQSIHATLRGRPWNPCDWRGVAAIAPDKARGDGWFEGARQFVRLVAVRYLGARDYTCGEINAQGALDARRVESCRAHNREAPPDEGASP